MIVRCVWCKRVIRHKLHGERWDTQITNGICDDCLKRYSGMEMRNKQGDSASDHRRQKETKQGGE
jgi:hypothetical protein